MRIASKRVVSLSLALLIGAEVVTAAIAQAPTVLGMWLDHEQRAAIEIERCDRAWCGRIVWLKEPTDPAGKPWLDVLNPEVVKRASPICGLQIVGDLKRESDGSLSGGWIYDPEAGKRFNLEIMLKDPGTLSVLAFDKDKVKSELMAWTRLPETQARCK